MRFPQGRQLLRVAQWISTKPLPKVPESQIWKWSATSCIEIRCVPTPWRLLPRVQMPSFRRSSSGKLPRRWTRTPKRQFLVNRFPDLLLNFFLWGWDNKVFANRRNWNGQYVPCANSSYGTEVIQVFFMGSGTYAFSRISRGTDYLYVG